MKGRPLLQVTLVASVILALFHFSNGNQASAIEKPEGRLIGETARKLQNQKKINGQQLKKTRRKQRKQQKQQENKKNLKQNKIKPKKIKILKKHYKKKSKNISRLKDCTTYNCYGLPNCINSCEWGYHCVYDNYCCRNYDIYGDISPPTEQDALSYALGNAAPENDINFMAEVIHKQCPEGSTCVLTCDERWEIFIKFANYRDQADANCPGNKEQDTNIVTALCQYTTSCAIPVNDQEFTDPCPGKPKTLTVDYSCVGQEVLDIQEFRNFENMAIKNFENEAANSTCSNMASSTLAYGICSSITWAKCLYYGYKDYRDCKTKCNGGLKCIIACLIKKLDTDPKCKGCIKALIKAICCHFIPKSTCCDMTDEEFESSYNSFGATAPTCLTVNEFETLAIICPSGTEINVTSALFGRPKGGCTPQSALTSKEVVNSYCQGHGSCNVEATPHVFYTTNCGDGIPPIPMPKLTVCYTCDPSN